MASNEPNEWRHVCQRLRERFGRVDLREDTLRVYIPTGRSQPVPFSITREPHGQAELLTICALLHRALELNLFEALRWNYHLRVGVVCVAGETALLRQTCLVSPNECHRIEEVVEMMATEAVRLRTILRARPEWTGAFAHLV